MIKNIMLLTKISTINYIQNINIIDKKANKIKVNKKSGYFWMIIILIIAITFISNKFVKTLQGIGQETMFPNIYFTFMFILLTFQSILICPNVYYFSKDIEVLLPYPIKPIELFIAKFNTIVTMLCVTELMFMLIPMIMYGIAIHIGIGFYIALLIEIILFPIFITLVISFINILFINFIKIIRNENVYQFIISMILVTLVFVGEYFFINNIVHEHQQFKDTLMSLNNIATYINQSAIVINPLIEILHQENIIVNIIKLFSIYSVIFIPFAYIGSKSYFRKILSTTSYSKKRYKNLDVKARCKPKSATKAYIENEIKYVVRNITFLIQYIFPVGILLIFGIIISIYFKFNFIEKNEEAMQLFKQLNLNVEGFCIILIILQVLFSLTNLSITAVSRHGKNSIFFKYIPISLYKQFWLKNILQICMSSVISIIVCFVIKFIVISIPIGYVIAIFIDGMLVGVLNSMVMLIVDLKRPLLDWKAEYEVIKQNSNKIFQYVYTISVVLLLMYFINIFDTINFNIVILIVSLIFIVLIFIIDKYVRMEINKNKMFDKIN